MKRDSGDSKVLGKLLRWLVGDHQLSRRDREEVDRIAHLLDVATVTTVLLLGLGVLCFELAFVQLVQLGLILVPLLNSTLKVGVGHRVDGGRHASVTVGLAGLGSHPVQVRNQSLTFWRGGTSELSASCTCQKPWPEQCRGRTRAWSWR